MKRREFLATAASAAVGTFGARGARAQAARVLRVGIINPIAPWAPETAFHKVLTGALAQHGYVLGRNLELEPRGAMGNPKNVAGLVDDLKTRSVDAVIVTGYPMAAACKAAGLTTVIAWGAGDPVETGLVDSWAHPGGIVTGISDVAATLTGKRLELLKEFAPQMRRVAMLWNQDDLGMSLRYQASAKTAQSLG